MSPQLRLRLTNTRRSVKRSTRTCHVTGLQRESFSFRAYIHHKGKFVRVATDFDPPPVALDTSNRHSVFRHRGRPVNFHHYGGFNNRRRGRLSGLEVRPDSHADCTLLVSQEPPQSMRPILIVEDNEKDLELLLIAMEMGYAAGPS